MRNFLHSVHSLYFISSDLHSTDIFHMRPSLTLPVASRHVISPIIPEISELEPPVESAPLSPSGALSPTSASERVVNHNITKASLNAERNRRMSMDIALRAEKESDHTPERALRPRISSVTFGNESEVEYTTESVLHKEESVVRHSKEFDGSRSGNPSLKK